MMAQQGEKKNSGEKEKRTNQNRKITKNSTKKNTKIKNILQVAYRKNT